MVSHGKDYNMTDYGFIILHRKIQDSAIYSDSHAVHLWLHLLIKVNHKDNDFVQNGALVSVKRGQTITGRKKLSAETGIQESKITRLLDLFEKLEMIEQQTNNRNRLITVLSYDSYQSNEQQVNNKRTTGEQLVNTNNNDNKENNDNNKYSIDSAECLEHLNLVTGRNFKPSTKANVTLIISKLKDGYTLEQLKLVIDYKSKQWMGKEQQQYLRPSTLFNNKNFEGYLNDAQQGVITNEESRNTNQPLFANTKQGDIAAAAAEHLRKS